MKINQCPKHPNYKGMRKTKRDCQACKNIYETAQKAKVKNLGLFPSLTTPGQRFTVEHIIAEMSCIMLYGKQPPYFWRKEAQVPNSIKEHYKKVFFGAKNWGKKYYSKPIYGNNPIDVFKKTLYYTVNRYESEATIRREHSREVIIEEKKEVEDKPTQNFFKGSKKSKSKFKGIKELDD